jgi:DNA mismatch endonuclease (patch repair protein)
MTDVVDLFTRARMMASIGRKNTRPEMNVRRYLHAAGLRFRLHDRRLPGTPDIALPRLRTVIFVNGCFWHRHRGCRFATTPATRVEFWTAKFAANVARDRAVCRQLRSRDWKVVVFWECDADNELALDRLVWSLRADEPD